MIVGDRVAEIQDNRKGLVGAQQAVAAAPMS